MLLWLCTGISISLMVGLESIIVDDHSLASCPHLLYTIGDITQNLANHKWSLPRPVKFVRLSPRNCWAAKPHKISYTEGVPSNTSVTDVLLTVLLGTGMLSDKVVSLMKPFSVVLSILCR